MKARILIVEDHALNRRLARVLLESRGHVVLEATTCAEARAGFHDAAPDLVLMDSQIPGCDGETLLKEIRGDPALAGLKVIAVTAAAMAGDRERFLAMGFDDYISKPIDTRTFGQDIEAHLVEKAG